MVVGEARVSQVTTSARAPAMRLWAISGSARFLLNIGCGLHVNNDTERSVSIQEANENYFKISYRKGLGISLS